MVFLKDLLNFNAGSLDVPSLAWENYEINSELEEEIKIKNFGYLKLIILFIYMEVMIFKIK